jgi:hypothetical protein
VLNLELGHYEVFEGGGGKATGIELEIRSDTTASTYSGQFATNHSSSNMSYLPEPMTESLTNLICTDVAVVR